MCLAGKGPGDDIPFQTPGSPLVSPGVAGPLVPADWRQPAARPDSLDSPFPPCILPKQKPGEGMDVKKLILAGFLLLAATGAQAQGTGSNPNSHPVQAYTTLGPAGAGTYRESTQRDNYSTTGKPNLPTGTVGQRNPRY
jgi:hypothetical protein